MQGDVVKLYELWYTDELGTYPVLTDSGDGFLQERVSEKGAQDSAKMMTKAWRHLGITYEVREVVQ